MNVGNHAHIELEPVGYSDYLLPDGSYRFAVHRRLKVSGPTAPAFSQVLAVLLGLSVYRDDFRGPIGVDVSGVADAVHGPYLLDDLTPTSYHLVEASRAHELLDDWLGGGEEPWTGRGADGANVQLRDAQPAIQAWFASWRRLFDSAGAIAYLPAPKEKQLLESAWPLGEFWEWIVLDREGLVVHVLTVASD